MSLKPIHIFIALILVLILASFIKPYLSIEEGFATLPNGLTDTDNYYSSLVKLSTNDELYYDPPSGNVYTFVENTESSGNKVYNVTMYSPMGDVTKYKTSDSLSTSVKSLIQAKVGLKQSSWSLFTDNKKSNLIYVAMNQYTFLYLMDVAAQTNYQATSTTTAPYIPNYSVNKLYIYNGSTLQNTSTMNKTVTCIKPVDYTVYSADANDDKDSIDPIYDSVRTVYQLTKNVKYDKKNGNLLLCYTDSSTNKIDVYKRTSSTVDKTLSGTAPSGGTDESKMGIITEAYDPKIITDDKYGKFSILYWPFGKNTLVIITENFCDIVGISGHNKGISTISSAIFVIDGVTTTTTSGTTTTTTSSHSHLPSSVSDQFNHWSQYMLKTQVVPPVCPACPSCTGRSVCTNCGGQGGSGSKTSDNGSMAFQQESTSVGGVANNLVDKTTNVANTAIGGATILGAGTIGVAGGTIGTAGNLAGKTVDSVTGLAGKTVDTASNLVGGTIGTAADLLKSAGSGVSNLLSGDTVRVGYNQSYGYNRNNTGLKQLNNSNSQLQYGMSQVGGSPIDAYSYGGALQSKGSNFRPITADFSAFGK